MKKIENKEFFHIQILNHIGQEWSINEKYQIGKKYNNYYQGVINGLEIQDFLSPKKHELYIKKISDTICNTNNKTKINECDLKNIEIIQLKNILQEVQLSFEQYLKWIQEEIFEKIRKEKYSKLPSRKKCLWVCKFEDLSKWIKIFEERSSPKKILKIKATGIVHKADGGLIKPDTYSIQEFEKGAEEYWSGVIHNNNEIEFLFKGDIEILEKYETIDEIQNP